MKFKRFTESLIRLTCIPAVLLLSACATNIGKQEQARLALQNFFEQLDQGEFESAAGLYGGSYETLVTFNPDLDSNDYPALWRYGCQMNGLQCLTVRTATFQEVTNSGEYVFTVEFNTPDGRLFELGACCGEEPTMTPLYQFEYRVVEGGDRQFRVLDLPVYMP
jgi:hypothetical protein